MKNSIWVWVHHRDGTMDDVTLGLVQEAIQLAAGMEKTPSIVAVAVGNDFNDQDDPDPFDLLGACGVERVVHFKGGLTSRYQGDYFAGILSEYMKEEEPRFFLMAHDADTADLGPRLAAILKSGIVTHAVDLCVDDHGVPAAVRPIANGHLFEKLAYDSNRLLIATFLPMVLSSDLKPDTQAKKDIPIEQIDLTGSGDDFLRTTIVRVIEAAPEHLDISEADIILAAGRGVGKRSDNSSGLDSIHELAGLLGASVAGTRPVIDWHDLPFERQIGQTGKTVTPRLIINCGISGANEYTAGIEKSKQVIAINTDARARIFRFADLGIVGDLHRILPLLISRLRELKETN